METRTLIDARHSHLALHRPLSGFVTVFAGVVIVQGGHLFEHIVQLIQVYELGVPEDDALGLLGYVLQFQGTEEWLHLVFNASYLLALYALLFPLRRRTLSGSVPAWAFTVFAVGCCTGRDRRCPPLLLQRRGICGGIASVLVRATLQQIPLYP
jgi:hypothetical protein